MTDFIQRRATIEPSTAEDGSEDWYVELFIDGQLVRNAAFKTERGAQRVVNNHFKI